MFEALFCLKMINSLKFMSHDTGHRAQREGRSEVFIKARLTLAKRRRVRFLKQVFPQNTGVKE